MKKKPLFGIFLLLSFVIVVLTVGVSAEPNTTETFSLELVSPQNGEIAVTVDGVLWDKTSPIEKGKTIALSATPSDGYSFDAWDLTPEVLSEDQLKQANVTFVMPDADVRLAASFREIRRYHVRVEEHPFGEYQWNSGDGIYPTDAEVELVAKPSAGYRFVRWVDHSASLRLSEEEMQKSELHFSMPENDVMLGMEFERIKYFFKIEIEGEGEVTVEGKEANENGEYEFVVDEEIVLSAAADQDYVFVRWNSDGNFRFEQEEMENTAFSAPAQNFTIKVYFSSAVKNLTITSTSGGKVMPTEGMIRFGVENIYELNAVPEEGYVFDHWECSVESGSFSHLNRAETSFTMPNEDCIVTAVFRLGEYSLKLLASAGGTVEGVSGEYRKGTTVALRAVAYEGYVFTRWESSVADAVADPFSAETSVVMPGEDIQLTAVFILRAALDGNLTPLDPEDEGGFPVLATVIIFVVSALFVGLIMIRDRYRLSYRHLIKRLLTRR